MCLEILKLVGNWLPRHMMALRLCLAQIMEFKSLPNIFIHCLGHKLNLVLSKNVDQISSTKIFSKTLSDVVSFLTNSTKRNAHLNEKIKQKFPTFCTVKWPYSSRVVRFLSEN